MRAFLFCFVYLISMRSFAIPKRILILRHAEKPTESSDHLSEKGFERANRLKFIFNQRPDLTKYGLPEFLFATKYISGENSLRTFETISPLSNDLNLNIQNSFLKDETKKLADLILNQQVYNNKVILICWTHSEIPNLVKNLGLQKDLKWKSSVFDRFWVIDYENGNVNFSDLPQKLFTEDSD